MVAELPAGLAVGEMGLDYTSAETNGGQTRFDADDVIGIADPQPCLVG